MTQAAAPPNDPAAARRFVLELGRAMHALGSPSYRVEDAMSACARSFGLEGNFFATPTAIFAQLRAADEEPSVTLQRVQPGDHDLAKLAQLYAERDDVVLGRRGAQEGLLRVRAVLEAPARQPRWIEAPAHALAAAAASVFLGGGAVELLAAGACGLLAGLLLMIALRRPRFRRAYEPAAAAASALLAHCAAVTLGSDAGIVTLAGIVPLLPGLQFTTALSELAMRHLAAGSARLLGSLALMLTLAVGVGLGARVGVMLVGAAAAAAPSPLPTWTQAPTALVSALGFAVMLRAGRRQLLAVFAAVAAAFCGVQLGSLLFQRELAAFVGAFFVAVTGSLYARWRRRPSAVIRTPGLLLLVPGSLGFRGLTTALQEDFTLGSQFAFRMLLVGGALVAGLLVANVLVPPPLDVEPESPA